MGLWGTGCLRAKTALVRRSCPKQTHYFFLHVPLNIMISFMYSNSLHFLCFSTATIKHSFLLRLTFATSSCCLTRVAVSRHKVTIGQNKLTLRCTNGDVRYEQFTIFNYWMANVNAEATETIGLDREYRSSDCTYFQQEIDRP